MAITFTNKAVAEMKQRILDNLFTFASSESPSQDNPLFQEISKQLDLSEVELREHSNKTLTNLLHNYAFFDVSTIDRFNHRLIRTFAKDLNISQNFEVELDTDYVLNNAVNQLLTKAGKDEKLTSIFVDFALEKIEDGNSWNISFDLTKIGKLIFQENHYGHLKHYAEKNLEDFESLKNTIQNKITILKKEIRQSAKDALELIKKNGLDFTDFKGGYFPKFLQQVIDTPLNIDFTAKWKGSFEETPLYNTKADDRVKSQIDGLRNGFNESFGQIKTGFYKISFLERFRKNVVPLALLSEIQKEIEDLKNENPFLTINEFNGLISKEIKKQPIPYIYERLGERYRHYFIDEFQDTSILQWENLIPLIGDALESKNDIGQQGSLLLVGDVKQSIYRWRGGEPQQFINLIYGSKNPFTITPKIEHLQKNWRSHDEIINFNNSFFSFIANKIENEEHRKLYENGSQQETNDKKGGVVTISFVPNDNRAEVHPHAEKTLNSISNIVAHGHSYADICILVRNKMNEKLIAEYLIENEIPVISADGLLLSNNEIVRFLVSCIEFVLEPTEREFSFSILEFLYRDSHNKHDEIYSRLDNLSQFLKVEHEIDVEDLKFGGTLNFAETLITKFNLASKSNAYVVAFLDEILEYEKSKEGGLFGFLEYWNLKKDRLALPVPENMAAVNIMTIHKSKGLEFKFVILPFADDVINDSRKQNDVWVPVNPDSHAGFSELMVSNNKYLPYYSQVATLVHGQENEKSELDDFNVLYVALTRAVYGLHIISSPVKANSKQVSYASLLSSFLEQNVAVDASYDIVFGELLPNKENLQPRTSQTIPYMSSKSSVNDLELANQEFDTAVKSNETIEFGNLIHMLLAEVYSEEDIIPVINKYAELGTLKDGEIKMVEDLLQSVVQKESLKSYFAKNIVSKNEIEILQDDGSVIRPDKLVFKESKVSVIDYKTGQQSENHKLQLEHYTDVLGKMGYEIEDKVLVYINDEVNTIAV